MPVFIHPQKNWHKKAIFTKISLYFAEITSGLFFYLNIINYFTKVTFIGYFKIKLDYINIILVVTF